MCTAEGEVLANAVSKTVLGPPGLSVADARVYEAAGATVDFAVTLGRAARETVTVDYATADGPSEGGAVAGEDYTAASGTLSFAAGETAKTVSVPVLNDAHDEGEETFTLTLSNPSGGNAWLRDATATGTIENTDAMPRAWLARFGRTVAEQVLDAVEGRLRAAPRPGIEMSLAGQAIGTPGSGSGAGAPEDEDARAQAAAELEARSRLGYGFAAFGDRFTATPELGLGLSQGHREYSLGWRLGLAQTGPTALELRLEATRREHVNDNAPEHGIGFRVTARW